MRTVQSLSVTIPTELTKKLDIIQKKEMKSCSAIITEALRQYIELAEYRKLQKELSAVAGAKGIITPADINKVIHEAR